MTKYIICCEREHDGYQIVVRLNTHFGDLVGTPIRGMKCPATLEQMQTVRHAFDYGLDTGLRLARGAIFNAVWEVKFDTSKKPSEREGL